jgi:hypothetical protein
MARLLDYYTKSTNIQDSDVVILTGYNPFKLLQVEYKDKHCLVWNYNKDHLNKILSNLGVNNNKYTPLGSLVRFSGIDPPRSILLSTSLKTNKYVRIGKIDNATIWKPLTTNKSVTNIGYVLTCSDKKPKQYTGLLPKDIVDVSKKQHTVILGEFYLVNFEKKLTIKRIAKWLEENTERI